MKTKVTLLLIAGFLFSTFGAFAQKGVDNGTLYGSGEDSVRCITNISLYTPYARSGDFASAYPYWKIVYEECPAAHKDIYLYGVRIVDWQIKSESDPAKKAALIDDLMAVYDKRVKYFGDDPRYAKDWIVSRKAQDYIGNMTSIGGNIDFNMLYGWLKEVVDEYDLKTEALAVSLFMFASHQRLLANTDLKEEYVQNYLKASAILDAQLEAARAAGDEANIGVLTTFKAGADEGFAGSGAADCETLQNLYADRVEQNKSDLAFLKETIALLRRVGCNEIEAYFAASGYAHAMEPTAESAIGLARQAVKKRDNNTAIKFFEEAANLSTDAQSRAESNYLMALLYLDQNNYSRARQHALKAIEENPNYGSPYLLIGRAYAATASSIYPNDPVLRKTVYYAAVDKFERARQVDPSCAAEATPLINSYRNYFPTTEEVFMHPDLEKGKVITIGGWIGERTTIR